MTTTRNGAQPVAADERPVQAPAEPDRGRPGCGGPEPDR